MQIDSQMCSGGVRLIDIRLLFRKAGLSGLLSTDFVSEEMGLPEPVARALLVSLESEGFVEPSPTGWSLTKQGVRLRAASAARPLLRATADRLLQELIRRIEELNRSPLFLARVKRAFVFGSYLSEVDRLGDLDIAIEWQRREANYQKHLAANQRRVAEEISRGRHFGNMIDELYWWQREAILFLRNRKRGLSIHDYASEKEIIDTTPHRIVFQKRRRLLMF